MVQQHFSRLAAPACAAFTGLVAWRLAVSLQHWLSKRRCTRASLDELCPCSAVRESASYISEKAQHVHINRRAIQDLAQGLSDEDLMGLAQPAAFDRDLHFADGTWRTVQYLLVVDTLNFCFWPSAHACKLLPCMRLKRFLLVPSPCRSTVHAHHFAFSNSIVGSLFVLHGHTC